MVIGLAVLFGLWLLVLTVLVVWVARRQRAYDRERAKRQAALRAMVAASRIRRPRQ